MCLICVEYNKKRMTKTELNKALPEMVMFAKTEEERIHYKKLQTLSNSTDELELSSFTDEHSKDHGKKTR